MQSHISGIVAVLGMFACAPGVMAQSIRIECVTLAAGATSSPGIILAMGQPVIGLTAAQPSGRPSAYLGFVPCAMAVVCPADVDNGSGSGVPDQAVTIDDLLYFLTVFEAGDVLADLDNGTNTGTPDNAVTIDDLLYFLLHFEGGC